MKMESSQKVKLIILCALAFIVVSAAQFTISFSQGPNNRNVSVDTWVNITGSIPIIQKVLIGNPITLGAGAEKIISCNVSIQDYNGYDDVDTVNATLFRTTVSLTAPDNNNTHYTNTSCAEIAGQASGNNVNYTCTFGVWYYAQNGTWNCTAVVNDSINLNSTLSNLTNISALFALNVTEQINYGQLAMGDTSGKIRANVSNLGNTPINVTVEGYGTTIGDGIGMVCEVGTLSLGLQHFAQNNTAAYAAMQALTGAQQMILNFTVPKATNNNGSLNDTYWQLYLDPLENAFGVCNGTVIFQAEQP